MTLAHLFRASSIIERQEALLQKQNVLIADQQQELRRVHLDYNREMRGIVSAWLINLEKPELDVRGDLADLDARLANRVAELEEHVL